MKKDFVLSSQITGSFHIIGMVDIRRMVGGIVFHKHNF